MRILAGTVSHQFMIAFGEGRAAVPYIDEKASLCQTFRIGLNTSDKSRTEYDDIHFRQFCAVQDFTRIITEIERYGNSAAFKDTKINGKPFQAVIHQDGYLFSLFHASPNQHVGKAIGLFIEYAPGNLPPVGFKQVRLNQIVFFPCSPPGVLFIRIQLHQCYFIGVHPCISVQKICNWHFGFLLIKVP